MPLILRTLLAASLFSIGMPVAAQPAPDWALISVEELEAAAKKGIKPAQLELGKRLEVQGKLEAALKWYRKAGRDVKSKAYVYSPPVGNEAYGRVITHGGDNIVHGLDEARGRASQLEEKLKLRSR